MIKRNQSSSLLRTLQVVLFAAALFVSLAYSFAEERENLSASGTLPEEPSPAKGIDQWNFYIQPYSDAQIFLNGKKKKFRLLKSDKTLGFVSVHNIQFTDHDELKLVIKKGGKDVYKRTLKRQEVERKDDPLFFQLMPEGSRYELVRQWAVGSLPKSVTFLDSRRVAVPLLSAQGIDVVNILTGERHRVNPEMSKKIKGKGFVETEVLGRRGEFVVSQLDPAALHLFSLKDLSFKKTLFLKGKFPKDLVYVSGESRLYSTNWLSRDISVVDLESFKEIKRIDTKGVPRGIIPSKDGKYLYVAQFSIKGDGGGGGKIGKIDLKSEKILASFGPPGAKRHMVRGKNDRMYVSDMFKSHIEVYDMKNDKLIKIINVYKHPNTIVLSPDGKTLYVSCRGPNNKKSYLLNGAAMGRIYAIDVKTLNVAEFWEGGNQPTGLDISPDGKYLVSSDFKDGRIRVYEIKETKI